MTILRFLFRVLLSQPTRNKGRGTKWPESNGDEMRNRKKKGPTGDTGNKPQPKPSETLPEVTEETKDVQVKETSKPKPTRLRACAWLCVKLILFLVVLAVLAVLFMIFVMPRIMSEMQVIIYLYLACIILVDSTIKIIEFVFVYLL